MIPRMLPFGSVKKKITEKLKIVASSDDANLSYKCPKYPNLPPYNVYDQEDYDTFGYLNIGMCEGDVWPIPLHISCYKEVEVFEEKPILNHNLGEEVMDVRLSAPENVSQFDATCGRARMDGNTMVDGRNVDEILAGDALEDEMIFTGGETVGDGRIFQRVAVSRESMKI